ncbi:hypothetical protein DSL72_001940 [Monilinia vaccinii-corymbosi]|uniref:Uncharacterized protein n=1 Tax=Monilinia vaccinii-corymbosi TaxID=61207 RepID=A0A8A3PB80_9HELO|nr:hypothetical protein DSL72_001940 [Monilinia vaccinii-corymbosi]
MPRPRSKRMRDLCKALGFDNIESSELRKKMDIFVRDQKLPVMVIKSSNDPEAENWQKDSAPMMKMPLSYGRRAPRNPPDTMTVPDFIVRIFKNITSIFALKIYHRFYNQSKLQKQTNVLNNNLNLNNEPSQDSDGELLIPSKSRNLQTRAQLPQNDYTSLTTAVSSNADVEPSEMGHNREITDSSNIKMLRSDTHLEDPILHTRLLKPKDDQEKMRDFISKPLLEDKGAAWADQSNFEPDHYILRFMHEFMYYNTDQNNMDVMNFMGLFYDVPSLQVRGNIINDNTLKSQLINRVRKLVASLVSSGLLKRSCGTGPVSRTKELDEAWEQRNQLWSQPVDETESHSLQSRDTFTMPPSPDGDEYITQGLESSLDRISQSRRTVTFDENALAQNAAPRLETTILNSMQDDFPIGSPQMCNSQSTFTPPVNPIARESIVKLESIQPAMLPPQPQIQRQMEEQSSEDDTPLATFSNDINFVLLAQQKFDFECPLIFNIAELENVSLSSFISKFAQRVGVKEQKIKGLKFTILLGDNRSEKVVKGEERRWEQVVEIIGDLWKYSQVQWTNNPRMKSKACKILTERFE